MNPSILRTHPWSRVLLLATIISLLLVACTDSGSESAESDEDSGETDEGSDEGLSDEPVELRLIIWDSVQLETQEAIAAAFNEKHPTITVNVELLTWDDYWPVAQTSVDTGSAPDLMWMNASNFPVFHQDQLLLPLDDGIDLSAFPPALVDLNTVGGVRYGVPKEIDTMAMFYNKNMFDDAGLDYPTNDWTWTDLQTAAAALTTEGAKGFIPSPHFQEYVLPLMAQTGTPFLSPDRNQFLINEGQACDLVEFMDSFVEDGTGTDWDEVANGHPAEMFAQEKAAIYYDGPWAIAPAADYAFEVGVAELPAGAEEGNVLHGLSWVARADTEHPAAATAFLEFVATDEAQLLQTGNGAVIPARAGTQHEWLNHVPEGMDGQVFIDAAQYAVSFPIATAPFVWVVDATQTMQDGLIAGTEPTDVCQQVAASAAESIQENSVVDG